MAIFSSCKKRDARTRGSLTEPQNRVWDPRPCAAQPPASPLGPGMAPCAEGTNACPLEMSAMLSDKFSTSSTKGAKGGLQTPEKASHASTGKIMQVLVSTITRMMCSRKL
jgi:hypothetical protein